MKKLRDFRIRDVIRLLLASGIMYIAAEWVRQSLPAYNILVGMQQASCLPWDVYFWKQPDKVTFGRHDLVLFSSSEKMEPYFPKGIKVIKMSAGMPGDKITIRNGELYINGDYIDNLKDGARALKKPLNHWDTEYVLQQDEVFMLGTEPNSFDSRYWGPYPKHLVRGRVFALF